MTIEGSVKAVLAIISKFGSLPVEKRLAIFRDLSPRAREELLCSIDRPQEIVRRISEEEAYFTIKEAGPQNAPAMLALTTGRQLLYLLDLELWKKDMFDYRAAGYWMEILADIGEEKILQFVQVSDPETLLIALGPMIRVHIVNPDVDIMEQLDHLPQFTLEGTFYVEFRHPELEETLKSILETIFRWDVKFYFGLMEHLASGLMAEEEETALKWRRARLADKGFPDFDEAVEIYRYLGRDGISRTPADDLRQNYAESLSEGMLDYPLKVIDSDTLFRQCLSKLDEIADRDRLARELAHVANKIMVADGRDPGNVDEVYRSLRKAGGYINIALEEICGEQLAQAIEVVKANHMEFLFRRGFSLILDLRKDAMKLFRQSEGGIDNLGHPLAEIVNGLLSKRPVYPGKLLGDGKAAEFEHLSELDSIKKMLDPSIIDSNWEPI